MGVKWFTQAEIDSWPVNHKRCRGCNIIKPFNAFHNHKRCLFGINTICIDCRIPRSKLAYDHTSIEYRLWYRAKRRAKIKGLSFTISIEDIHIPDVCPILDVPLKINTKHAPSLDRLNNDIGYVKGNVQVISTLANSLKNSLTIQQITRLYNYIGYAK